MNSNQSHKIPYAIKALRKQKKISPFLSTKNIIPNVPKHESQKDQTAPASIWLTVVVHKFWTHKSIASQIAAVMLQLHLES